MSDQDAGDYKRMVTGGPFGPRSVDHATAAEVLLQSAMNHGNSGEAAATIAMVHAVLALIERADALIEHLQNPPMRVNWIGGEPDRVGAEAMQRYARELATLRGPQPDRPTGRWPDDLPTIDNYLKITRDLLRQFPDQPDAQIAKWAKEALNDRTFWPGMDE